MLLSPYKLTLILPLVWVIERTFFFIPISQGSFLKILLSSSFFSIKVLLFSKFQKDWEYILFFFIFCKAPGKLPGQFIEWMKEWTNEQVNENILNESVNTTRIKIAHLSSNVQVTFSFPWITQAGPYICYYTDTSLWYRRTEIHLAFWELARGWSTWNKTHPLMTQKLHVRRQKHWLFRICVLPVCKVL